jgi:hypothetical protein
MVRLRRGALKRIVLLATVGVVVATMLIAGGLSVGSAQEETAGQVEDVCAPWSKTWDVSEGYWYYAWYRWCYDPATSDPSVEESWYIEGGDWEWAEQANFCPESGTCTMASGSMRMVSGTS